MILLVEFSRLVTLDAIFANFAGKRVVRSCIRDENCLQTELYRAHNQMRMLCAASCICVAYVSLQKLCEYTQSSNDYDSECLQASARRTRMPHLRRLNRDTSRTLAHFGVLVAHESQLLSQFGLYTNNINHDKSVQHMSAPGYERRFCFAIDDDVESWCRVYRTEMTSLTWLAIASCIHGCEGLSLVIASTWLYFWYKRQFMRVEDGNRAWDSCSIEWQGRVWINQAFTHRAAFSRYKNGKMMLASTVHLNCYDAIGLALCTCDLRHVLLWISFLFSILPLNFNYSGPNTTLFSVCVIHSIIRFD